MFGGGKCKLGAVRVCVCACVCVCGVFYSACRDDHMHLPITENIPLSPWQFTPQQHGQELQIRIKARCPFHVLQQVYSQRILSLNEDTKETLSHLTFLFRGKRLKPEQVYGVICVILVFSREDRRFVRACCKNNPTSQCHGILPYVDICEFSYLLLLQTFDFSA